MAKREETEEELLKRFQENPHYQHVPIEQLTAWASRDAMLTRDEAPVVDALGSVGEPVRSIWDLVNTRRAYPHVIQTLVEDLSKPYRAKTIEGIARALTVVDARGIAAKPLIALFQRWPGTETSPKWEVDNAIGFTAMPDDVEALMRLAMERSHGLTRDGIVAAFARLGNDRTDQVVLRLLEDPTVGHSAARVAGKRKLFAALPALHRLADGPDKDVAKIAKKAIKKLEASRR